MEEKDLFEREQEMLKEGAALLKTANGEFNLWISHYKKLLQEFNRVVDQSQRLIRIGDMMQLKLTRLAQELQIEIQSKEKAEAEKENLRSQLLQSQKMETMGTLATGIAHDFNNMLTVILGYSSFLLADKNEKDPGYKGLQNIVKTAQDAADLVQRIRISGRKAEMILVPLDLNHQVDEVTKLLSSTLPKMIEMDIHLAKDPVIIKADPSQITQMV
ncbi:MAG: hypothetical protein WCJ75_16910, partial [Desulfomonile sp.]